MKYLNHISINILFLLFSILVLITPAQYYPDTLKIPVTLYDFHSDGSCPDFNPGTSSKDVKIGMVQDTLDSDGRPVHKNNGEYFSYYVANWFRSSEAGEQPVTDTMPTYNSDGKLSGLTMATENLYVNKKFYDTLIFIHDNNGIYKYNNDEFFPLDGIGFGNENTQTTGSETVNNHNYSFSMMMEHEFTYKSNMTFNFCGDDDVWVFIDGNLVLDIGGIHGEKCKDFELNDFETELGLKEGSRYRLSFFFAERQATHSQVEITTNILTPAIDSLHLNVSPNDTIYAGDSAVVIAQVFMDTSDTQIVYNNITWGFADTNKLNDPDSTFTITGGGDSALITPTKAPTVLKVWASVVDSVTNDTLYDTVLVWVLVGPPEMLVIEADTGGDPYDPDPVDTVTIYSTETTVDAHAILRDKEGNYIGPSTNTDWKIFSGSVAKISSGNALLGEGILEKIANDGTTGFSAKDAATNLNDNSVLKILSYYYVDLKIIVKNPVDYSITSLNMNTNQDTTLYVQGKRSDNGAWENVNADWFASQSIKTTSAPPKMENSWFVSPTDSGRGIIYANLNDLADTLITTISVGHATKISIDFITEPDNRIAGEPIEALVTVKNNDNMLIPGTTPSTTTFSDLLPNIPVMKNVYTGAEMIPSIIHGQDTVAIKNFKDINLIFVDGKATVYFLLYYVPPSNTNILHDIKVERNDSITNYITLSDHETTVLHPGPLAKITIDPGDTVVFNEGDSKRFSTTGVDLYGNSLGLVSSDWSLESSLPQKAEKNNPHFLYDPGFDKKAEGYLTANSVKNNKITDKVYIILTASKTKIISALTQDITGNGYLDAIKIKFDREIIIPQNSQPGNTSVSYYYEGENIEFKITGIVPVNDTTNTEYYLRLEENRKQNVPQTDWLPVLNFDTQIQDVADVNEYQCKDGAGPVIWKVEKYIYDIYDHTKDVVTVTISENFNYRDGSEFLATGPVPQFVFNVWQFNAVNDTTEIKDALNQIRFLRKEGNKIIFTMENGFNLTAKHYLNLNHINGHVCDALLNLPNANNQKVRVVIKGNIGKITVGPNPIIPTTHNHEKLKYQPLQHFDPNLVYNWVKTHGGAMVSVNINAFKEVDIYMLVFDAIGNLVYDKQGHINLEEIFINNINTDDLLPLCFYWNGINNNDMKTAPGVYRMIIRIKAPAERESQDVSITVAVGR